MLRCIWYAIFAVCQFILNIRFLNNFTCYEITKLKIILVHNHYKESGGEDTVVAAEQILLECHGHQIYLFNLNNNRIQGVMKKLKVAWETPYSDDIKITFSRVIRDVNPDIVHVHNFFPLITPAVFDACHDAGVPVVQTLHNFRLICPGALLIRNGKICEICATNSPYHSVLYSCYRGSCLGTLSVARMVSKHRNLGTWNTKVDCFIVLTEFARQKFILAGFPADKLIVKPNFVGLKDYIETSDRRSGALFVGRLSQEKGIKTLFKAWEGINNILKIIGDGPLHDEARTNSIENINFLGRKSPLEILSEMKASLFLIMPSECYETFGMVIIEAFACGLPVIASRLGAMAELVEDGITGLLFTPGDIIDLTAKIRWALENPEMMNQMGERAKIVYTKKYTSEHNYQQLVSIYQTVLSNKNSGYE